MKIRFRDQVQNIMADFPVSLFFYQRFGRYYLQVSGLEDSKIAHIWIDDEVKVDEYIEFELIIMDKDCCTQPVEKKEAFVGIPLEEEETASMYEQQLAKFYSLEALLKREGLI